MPIAWTTDIAISGLTPSAAARQTRISARVRLLHRREELFPLLRLLRPAGGFVELDERGDRIPRATALVRVPLAAELPHLRGRFHQNRLGFGVALQADERTAEDAARRFDGKNSRVEDFLSERRAGTREWFRFLGVG